MERNEAPARLSALAFLLGPATAVWATWCSFIALICGTMPLIGIHVDDGSIIGFLLMLFTGEPILISLAYWAGTLILMPLALATSRRPRP